MSRLSQVGQSCWDVPSDTQLLHHSETQSNEKPNNSSLKGVIIMEEQQMMGPTFSQNKFKTEIDLISAKLFDDVADIRRSPVEVSDYSTERQSELLKSRNKNANLIVRTEFNLHERHNLANIKQPERLSLSVSHSRPNININLHPFKEVNDYYDVPIDEGEITNKNSYNNDEINQSFDLADPNSGQIYAGGSIVRSQHGQQQQTGQNQRDEELERYYTQGFLNLGNTTSNQSNNGLKIRGLNNNPEGDHRRLSNLSSMGQIEFLRMNESSLSPTKLYGGNDLISKSGYLSEVGTPSNTKKHRTNGAQGQGNFLTLVKVQGNGINEPSMMEASHSHREEGAGFTGAWAKNPFLILTLMKKFVSNLKQLSMRYKFRLMKPRYFELIDDKSSEQGYYRMQGMLKSYIPSSFEKKLRIWRSAFNRNFVYIDRSQEAGVVKKLINWIFMRNLDVLLPDSFGKIIWDCIIMFLLCLNVFYIPMKISFDQLADIDEYLLIVLEDLPSWAFVCDILITFNTAYYSKGVIESKRSKIFKHYVRGKFAWELLIAVPFLFSSLFNVPFLNIILLFRSNKIMNIVNSFEEMLNLRQYQQTIMSLLKLIFTIIYIAHICGCFFYYMHVLQTETDPTITTWVVFFKLNSSGWGGLYVSSVYWAVITMITLGYGDIYPVTTLEKIYVILVTLVSCGVFAYAVNAIGYILQEYSKKNSDFRIKMSVLTNHMRKRDISNNTQMKVKKYFEYFLHEEQQDNEDGQGLLNQCTIALRNEVLTEMYTKVLASRKEFRLNFSPEFLNKLAPKMLELRLNPEEIIFSENTFTKRVYFLMRGNVALQRTRRSTNENSNRKQDINIKILKKGDLFGLESFLSGSETLVSAKSLNVVQLVYLQEEEFLQVIEEFKSDKERYFMIKDKLNLQNASRGLGINCYLCDSFVHQFLNCPYMSYQPNHKKVITLYQKDHNQERCKVVRERDHSARAIVSAQIVQELAIKHLLDNNPFDTISELLEKIQEIEDEGGLQIDTPHIITKYIKDPQEFDDLDDMGDGDLDYYVRSNNDGQTPNVMGFGGGEYEDSVRIRRGTIGSNSRHERAIEPVPHIAYGRYGSLRMNRNSATHIPAPNGLNSPEGGGGRLLDPPRRNEERKSSFRKQTMFSNQDQVYIIKGNDPQSPVSRKVRRNSLDTGSVNIPLNENVNGTPLMHHMPSTPQLERNRDRPMKRNHFRSAADDDSVDQRMPQYLSRINSQVSAGHQLEHMHTVSIKSRLNESRHESGYALTQFPASSMVVVQKDFMILQNFDAQKEWKEYFPHNNHSQVLSHFQKLLEKRLQASKRKKRRQGQNKDTQKFKQLFSNIQARNQYKNNTNRFTRNQLTKTSMLSRHESSSANQIGPALSNAQPSSPQNGGQREISRSVFSQLDNNSEFPK